MAHKEHMTNLTNGKKWFFRLTLSELLAVLAVVVPLFVGGAAFYTKVAVAIDRLETHTSNDRIHK